jgi:hypothetical protein
MRRTWLRGHANILKRYLVHIAAFNFGVVMRKLLGAGTPRGLADLQAVLRRLLGLVVLITQRISDYLDSFAGGAVRVRATDPHRRLRIEMSPSSTGC